MPGSSYVCEGCYVWISEDYRGGRVVVFGGRGGVCAGTVQLVEG